MAQLDQHLAEALDGGDQARRAESLALRGQGVDLARRQLHQLGRHQRQEPVAQVAHQLLGDGARVVPGIDEGGHRRERLAGIVGDQRLDELIEAQVLTDVAARTGDQLERRQGVTRRARPLADGGRDGVLADVESGVGGDPAHVLGQRVGSEQVEAQVLGAAADRVGDLLRVGGGEHEHDVARRFLQRLQQRRLGRLRQHVHLVEDVHLVPPGRAQLGLLDQVAHRLDAVVAGGVELVHVVADAALDLEARCALAARLAVDRALAVEDLGEDAGRCGLAGAARPGEEVGLALTTARHGVAQRPHDVVLALDLGESPWPVAAVERLGGHDGEPTEGVSRG